MKQTIIIIDDEPDIRDSVAELLKNKFTVLKANNSHDGLALATTADVSVVVLDYRLPDKDGLSILPKLKKLDPTIEVIMITALVHNPRIAFKAAKSGAYDYLLKPFNFEELYLKVCRAAEKRSLIKTSAGLQAQLESAPFLGDDPAIAQLRELALKVANHDTPIMIEGETGTGKEVLAQFIHQSGQRQNKPFIAVHCGALNSTFLESDLFGHERGAFTGAHSQRVGKFELACEGTLFLDELGTMPEKVQIHLLRVLENKTIERLGGNRNIPVDTRIISATNTDLKKAVADGSFRQDLYYRLNMIPLYIPPLRERQGDIGHLSRYFMNIYKHKYSRNFNDFDEFASECLKNWSWPGNVRELKYLIERVISTNDDQLILLEHLPLEMQIAEERENPANLDLKSALRAVEKRLILNALRCHRGNQNKAAQGLGIAASTLSEKRKALQI